MIGWGGGFRERGTALVGEMYTPSGPWKRTGAAGYGVRPVKRSDSSFADDVSSVRTSRAPAPVGPTSDFTSPATVGPQNAAVVACHSPCSSTLDIAACVSLTRESPAGRRQGQVHHIRPDESEPGSLPARAPVLTSFKGAVGRRPLIVRPLAARASRDQRQQSTKRPPVDRCRRRAFQSPGPRVRWG